MVGILAILLLLTILGVLALLLGIGIALATAVLAGIATLTALGILSSSTLIALQQRSLRTGLKVATYQSLTILGLATGAGVSFLTQTFLYPQLPLPHTLALGALSGALAGTFVAYLWISTARWLIKRLTTTPERGFPITPLATAATAATATNQT